MDENTGLDDLSMPLPKDGFELYENQTRAAYPDMDAGPTKAYMMLSALYIHASD